MQDHAMQQSGRLRKQQYSDGTMTLSAPIVDPVKMSIPCSAADKQVQHAATEQWHQGITSQGVLCTSPLLDKYIYTTPMPCSTHADCACSGRSSGTKGAPRLGWVPIEEEQAQRGGCQRQHEVQAEEVAVADRGAVSGVARERPQVVKCYLHCACQSSFETIKKKSRGGRHH